jgi:LysM domain
VTVSPSVEIFKQLFDLGASRVAVSPSRLARSRDLALAAAAGLAAAPAAVRGFCRTSVVLLVRGFDRITVRGDAMVQTAVHRHRRPRLRLTRRGRLVLLVTVLGLIAAVAVAVTAVASQAADPVQRGSATAGSGWREVVARPGDTLWLIACRELPGRDPYLAINEIRQLNGLADYTIQPGQRLRLPVRA